MRITGKELNLAEDVFRLKDLLDCHLVWPDNLSRQRFYPTLVHLSFHILDQIDEGIFKF